MHLTQYNLMSITFELFCWTVLLIITSAVVLSVLCYVVSWLRPISASVVRVTVPSFGGDHIFEYCCVAQKRTIIEGFLGGVCFVAHLEATSNS
jgi:hypothetical protein